MIKVSLFLSKNLYKVSFYQQFIFKHFFYLSEEQIKLIEAN